MAASGITGWPPGSSARCLNEGDSILVIMQNGFTSATGQQYIPSSLQGKSGRAPGMEIEATLRALHVPWLRRVRTYSITEMIDTLREALTTDRPGLKIIIADGECQLARQRRLRAENAERLARRQRVALPRFGVDDEICTGDHSCIRLSGCPSLTVKPNPDPLRDDPGGHGGRELRRLRRLRRGRPCSHALPVLLPRRPGAQSRPVGAQRRPPAPRGYRLPWAEPSA